LILHQVAPRQVSEALLDTVNQAPNVDVKPSNRILDAFQRWGDIISNRPTAPNIDKESGYKLNLIGVVAAHLSRLDGVVPKGKRASFAKLHNGLTMMHEATTGKVLPSDYWVQS
jgi:hypothetical protein